MKPAGIEGGTDLLIRDSGFLGSRMRLPSVTRVLVAGMSQFGQGMYVGILAVMASRERSHGWWGDSLAGDIKILDYPAPRHRDFPTMKPRSTER